MLKDMVLAQIVLARLNRRKRKMSWNFITQYVEAEKENRAAVKTY